tara:strand:- start:3256 stop:5148 length:1893 start_codon:yes stop_codon:yes gene_type:complete
MAGENKDIVYVNKSFNDIRSQLINFSQTYFPNTYTDFSPSSPGMMFLEQSAYVSDILSFYLDNQIQETYLQYARQFDNLYDLAYMFSYKPKVTGLASVDLDFYQQIPSKTVGAETVPDFDYALYFDANTTATSATGQSFIITEPIDFTVSNSMDPTIVSVAQINSNEPEFYLLKKTRKGTSGIIQSQVVTMGAYEEFPTIELNVSNIGGIIDIIDSDGNQWYEVDYLGQDLVYNSIKNTNVNDPNNYVDSKDAPYLLQTKSVNRRFTTRFLNETTLQIQFGAGKPLLIDEEVIPNPDNVGLGLPFEQNKLTTAYSPTNFIFTNTYGIAPSNTTLTIRYLVGGGVSSNVNANSINQLSTSGITFISSNISSNTIANFIFGTTAVNNPTAASGGQDGDTIEEIRQNSLANYNTQLRNVTADDYLVRALSMPPSYGIIAKAHAQKPAANDPDVTLDLYVLSYNQDKNLTVASNTLKSNLQTYINQYRIIGDTINIKNAFIINICCDFEIITLPNYNNNEVLFNCITAVTDYFNIDNWQINQPIILRDISVLLDNIAGVQTVANINIQNKAGTNIGYSEYAYTISGATQGGVIYPSIDPMIFEVKYPETDIKGKVVSMGTGTFQQGTGTALGGY